ncbi:CesA-like Cellulose synthase (UDP-forming), family GT2 [Chondrus crispus]|uniref:CesA-like Cellulose synthase (UDP-forming), family GT2 n=1 Tax=Chondrus crispus TaxID=2769 RepID=R7QNH2_CHOCR|nr:CesA-like Cellulose synthase (UDP-forming), family GT2 [Chondrus crispus]CDF39654.1 CesA-like Cellulose synthase (UDP-forming), family GT2 [Chondrus crispus]|eukprot:XP_005709948.1 CesA-like Cellulose synthase (UDP-forming), family GT2 [Chondrus crispus]
MIFQFLAGIAYLQFRARETIGIFERSRRPHFLTYQIFFFVLEVISVFSVTFRFFEAWRVCRRNCIDFKYIPNHLIHPIPFNSPRNAVTKEHSNYPSIGVFIPCYNEDVDLVLETLLGAVHIDYPKQLLTIYLCDDGKDVRKRALVSQLRKRYKNIHYVIRPDHTHAKAGNLNYSLERTTTDIVITLDADFVARPNIAQRLLPYFYVWNPDIEKYEFNETLAVVQTPQHFRNLSPYDSDPLDQRSTFFFELVLPGKDWFNASTMIGTNNMLSRVALKEAGYYPYHSITEDTAMSLRFHQLGYRTYFVNESLATGLATTSLWSNLGQRARWLKGDWQILFSMKGPLTAKGLSLLQRLLYVHMTYARLISVVHFMYDVGAVLLLVFGISPLDAPDPKKFIIFVSIFLMAGIVVRVVLTAGGHGLDKSESGAMAFEPIFRYITVKGLFTALVKGQDLKFKVTDKSQAVKNGNKKEAQDEEEEETEQFQHDPRMTVLGRPSPETPAQGLVGSTPENVKHPEPIDNHVVPISGQDDSSSTSESEDEDGRGFKRRKRVRSAEEVQEHRRNIFKNLKRIWFNIVMAILLIFAITYGFINPPTDTQTVVVEVDGVLGTFAYQNILPLAMALGFAMVNLLPHLLAIYLCFIPYVSGWDMADLVHGRCDQYAVHPKTGKLFVPWSFISLFTIARVILMIGSVGALAFFTFGNSEPEFVPLSEG